MNRLLKSVLEQAARNEYGDAFVDAYPRKCSLCDETIKNFHESHNPQPVILFVEDRCCAKCNAEKVKPSRNANIFWRKTCFNVQRLWFNRNA